MLDIDKKAAANKKAYEVTYALFRVAANTNEQGILEVLKREAILILEAAIAEDYEKIEKPLAILDYFVKLAMDLGIIVFVNGEVLIKEMAGLRLMISECVPARDEILDVSSLFSATAPDSLEGVSSHDFFSREKIAVSRAEEYQTEHEFEAVSAQIPQSEIQHSGSNSTGGFLKSGMRQIAILDKIRQSGNCRLRDMQEILPDSSERTIRYDLESLIERRLIERVGNGGPSVFYRMRQN